MRKELAVLCVAAILTAMTGCDTEQTLPEPTENAEITSESATETETEPETTEAPTTEAPATETTAETTTATTAVAETEPTETETVTNVNMYGGIMVVNSGTPEARALELFSGSFKTGERYAKALNAYKGSVGEDVNVYCMVIPTSAAFYMPEALAEQYGSQSDNYDNIAANLENVIPVPVYEAMESHKDQYLYSRTDYHWQPLGAYYAAEQFAAAAGVPYARLNTYSPVIRRGYVGAFYAVNGIDELADASENFTYYKPQNLDSVACTYYNTAFGNPKESKLFFEDNSIGASYTVFVGRDDCILQMDTNVKNERVLVIFKDSYGNALVPFLTQSFSTVYLCDFRYFDCDASTFVEKVGATDVLFAMSTVACTNSGKVGFVEENIVN